MKVELVILPCYLYAMTINPRRICRFLWISEQFCISVSWHTKL